MSGPETTESKGEGMRKFFNLFKRLFGIKIDTGVTDVPPKPIEEPENNVAVDVAPTPAPIIEPRAFLRKTRVHHEIARPRTRNRVSRHHYGM